MKRFEVYLVALDPVRGAEMAKTRPCVVASPDELNPHLRTVVVVPLTSVKRRYRYRPDLRFANVDGQLAIDQLRVVDKSRLVRRVGRLATLDARRLTDALVEFFRHDEF